MMLVSLIKGVVVIIADKHRSLYQITYPFLWRRLEYLAGFVGDCDPNVAAIVLYGSVARGTAHAESDVDLLILVKEERQFFSPSLPHLGVHMLTLTEDHVPWSRLDFAWAFSPFVDQLECQYMTDDLIANIQRDGILVHRQPGMRLPFWIEQLHEYGQWKEEMIRQIQTWATT